MPATSTAPSSWTFETLTAEADCISIHSAATAESRYLFDADTFARMKSTALLVNTARGPIINEEALADALENGEIEAAALDVTEVEPLPSDSRLLKLPNCYITPHVAAVSAVFIAETAVMQAENLIFVLAGGKPHGLANPGCDQDHRGHAAHGSGPLGRRARLARAATPELEGTCDDRSLARFRHSWRRRSPTPTS